MMMMMIRGVCFYACLFVEIVLWRPLCVLDGPSLDVNPSSDDNDVADDDNEDDAVQSLLSGSTNLCDECAVSRSRQPICLPPLCSTIPIGFYWLLFLSTGYCWFIILVTLCFYWFLVVTLSFNRIVLVYYIGYSLSLLVSLCFNRLLLIKTFV